MASLENSDKDKAKRQIALNKKYNQRITIAKHARESFLRRDYTSAAKKYSEYLAILAEKNHIQDIYRLSPTMFDAKRDVTEMLLISHVYWEMARINEMAPKLSRNFNRSLDQFVKFTINQPYQVLNAEMLRKYIRKHKTVSPQIDSLTVAYQQIFVQSKKCFIATLCYGETHPKTQTLRNLKNDIVVYDMGIWLVRIYYKISDPLVKLAHKNIMIKYMSILSTKPLLNLIIKLLSLR